MRDQPGNSSRDQRGEPDRPDNGSGPGRRGGPPTPPPARVGRSMVTWVIFIGALLLLFMLLNQGPSGRRIDKWSAFETWIDPAAQKIVDNKVVIENNRISAVVKPGEPGFPASKDGTRIYFAIDPDPRTRADYREKVISLGVDFEERIQRSFWLELLTPLIPILLLFAIIWFFIARSMRSAGGGPGGMLGSFGKSRHRVSSKATINITFADVAGVDEAKDEVQEIVEFLKNPSKFQRLGGRIPRGVLLVGPPGCGKTLLAKAIAGEADVPFFSISGSDFVEMFVGVGASRVRDLFKQAKENSPCIIFLDEIDAVGRRRGGGFTTGGHDEREQTLNAILVEMDGFEASDQIIVIAATNRADVLDPALTRPGRFDRQVDVTLPDVVGRRQILDVHARKVKLAPEVDLDIVARGTPMFSGAELAALMNEAAIIATMAGKDAIQTADLEEARDKIRYGRARKSRRIEEEERVATAYHEAGHAVLQMIVPHADPLHKVTIIPRGQAMGATFSLPEKDRYGYGRRYLAASMRVLCGGRIAEERKTGDVSSGAAMDIRMATAYARHMILEWGMSDRLGFVNYAGTESRESLMSEREYSDTTAQVIDEEVRRMIDEAYAEATSLIDANWSKVVEIAEALLRFETLQRADVERIMRGEKLVQPTVADLLRGGSRPAVPPSPPRPAPAPGGPSGEEDQGGLLPNPA